MQPDLTTLAFVAQHTSNAVVITDRAGQVAWVNAGFTRITGYSVDEALGHKPGSLLQGQGTAPAAIARMKAAMRAGRGFSEELLNYRKDGRPFWNAIECSAIPDATGAITHFIAIQSDITERRIQEQALRLSAESLRALVSAMPLIIFATDLAGRITLIEGLGLEQLGLEASSSVGVSVFDLGHQLEILRFVPRALAGECIIASIVAHNMVFETRYSPLRDSSGAVIGALGVALDVTEQMQATAELVRARDAAEAATRAKSAFLATMSHEIRTPLNAVIGMADLLLDTPMSGEQRRYAETVRTSGDMLLAVINDILDFSKIEAGNMELERHSFDPRATLAEVIELLAPRAAAKGLGLAAAVDIGVPSRVVGDPTRLRQILVNLVGNAVKFTDQGEVLVRAQCRLRPADDHLDLALLVSDTGIGIPANRLIRLFHPFSQVDASTTRRYGGTGLGLAICKRLSELMGGTISVQSEPGQGSSFTVILPVGLASAAPHVVQTRDEAPASFRPLRILLAEDNSVNQQVALHMLKHLGYSADLAADGLAVLRACATNNYDVVLMDVQMPDLDGLEATRRLRAELPPERLPRIIAMTATAMAGVRVACLAAGMNDYLSKPVQRVELAAALRRVPTLSAPNNLVTLDAATLDRLRSDLGAAFSEDLTALVAAYRRQLRADIRTMHAGLSSGETQQVVSLAHRLRGASLTLGAVRAAQLGHALEHGGQRPHVEVVALIDALASAGEQAANALERLALQA